MRTKRTKIIELNVFCSGVDIVPSKDEASERQDVAIYTLMLKKDIHMLMSELGPRLFSQAKLYIRYTEEEEEGEVNEH